MITATLITNESITVVVDNSTTHTTRSDNPQWEKLKAAIAANNEAEILRLISPAAAIPSFSNGNLEVTGNEVLYRGKPLHGLDVERVCGFVREGLPYKPMLLFLEKKLRNPSARAINELYTFLEHRAMPIAANGNFLAYKGVQDNGYSVNGNNDTVVLSGIVDETGKILNRVGDVIEVERSSVDDDTEHGCSFGLHVGSLGYATGWGSKTLIVEVDPRDVICIPKDCSYQKLRCCKYKVVGEYTGPLPNVYSDEYGRVTPKDDATPTESVAEMIDSMTEGKYNLTREEIKERFVQCIRNVIGLGSDKEIEETDLLVDTFGVDSLDMVELVMAAEEEFGISIDDDELEGQCNTVGDCINILAERLNVDTTPEEEESTEELFNRFFRDDREDEDDAEDNNAGITLEQEKANEDLDGVEDRIIQIIKNYRMRYQFLPAEVTPESTVMEDLMMTPYAISEVMVEIMKDNNLEGVNFDPDIEYNKLTVKDIVACICKAIDNPQMVGKCCYTGKPVDGECDHIRPIKPKITPVRDILSMRAVFVVEKYITNIKNREKISVVPSSKFDEDLDLNPVDIFAITRMLNASFNMETEWPDWNVPPVTVGDLIDAYKKNAAKPELPKKEEVPQTDDEEVVDKDYERGLRDGKNRRKRWHKEGDEDIYRLNNPDLAERIIQYNNGYRDGRTDYAKKQ